MIRPRSTFLITLTLIYASCSQANPSASITGQVTKPGLYSLKGEVRLFDLVNSAQVKSDAYLTGATWLHKPAKEAQSKLKAGVLFDLGILKQHGVLSAQAQLTELSTRLLDEVARLPVTGRRPQNLDPISLELVPAANRILSDGDRLLYPSRPQTLRIVGAVENNCTPVFSALRQANDYLRDCPQHELADPDWLYVVEPDGRVLQLGIALWNRSQPYLPAPGAILFVPVKKELLSNLAEELNDDLAAFLATQPLPTDDHSQ